MPNTVLRPPPLRAGEKFYPLQLTLHIQEAPNAGPYRKEDIRLAANADIGDWMALTALAMDGYPCFDAVEYGVQLHRHIAGHRALLLRERETVIGAMCYSDSTGNIEFLAVHPQYRRLGVTKLFLDKLTDILPYGQEIALTTYRAGDKADTGYRAEYRRLGFVERELLVEYGYPTQRLVLANKNVAPPRTSTGD